MVPSNSVGAIADFNGGDAQSFDGVCFPEANTANEGDGFVCCELIDDLVDVCFCEIGWRHE